MQTRQTMNRVRKGMWVVFLAVSMFMIQACNGGGGGTAVTGDTSSGMPYSAVTSVEFQNVSQGQECGFIMDENALEQPTLFVINDQEKLDEFWSKYAANRPDLPQPSIDFSQKTLVALVDNIENNGGYSLTIQDVLESETQVFVTAEKEAPGPGDIVTDAITVPYHIVEIPRTDKEVVLDIHVK